MGKECDRASDYDDWNLNGDLLIWSDIIDMPIEITSMGIRVDKSALKMQLKASNEEYKKEFDYHKKILNDELPLTIGGGIGQSRLCMLLLQKAHIGEVQCSVWDNNTKMYAKENNIKLLK
jgi:aspartate--ammonia ligase